jgi:hypothetical protein
MQLFTVLCYVVALAWLGFRAGAAVKAAVDAMLEAQKPDRQWLVQVFWPLAPLFNGLFWSRFIRFGIDATFSLVAAVFTRLSVAGVASAPLGAILGLAISAGLTGTGAYYKAKSPKTQRDRQQAV